MPIKYAVELCNLFSLYENLQTSSVGPGVAVGLQSADQQGLFPLEALSWFIILDCGSKNLAAVSFILAMDILTKRSGWFGLCRLCSTPRITLIFCC